MEGVSAARRWQHETRFYLPSSRRGLTLGYQYETKSETTLIEVITGGECDNCKAKMEWDGHKLSGALRLSYGGGYAEFVDGSGYAVLCRDCAKKFFECFPVLWDLVE